MFWFVNIGILILGYLANKAIASYIRSKQKPPLLGPFTAPTVAPGQGITVSYGTTRNEGVTAAFYQAKLVEVNLNQLDNVFRIGKRTTLAYQYKITMLSVLGYGSVTSIANMMFGDKSLADQPMTQQYDDGTGTVATENTFLFEPFVQGAAFTGPTGGTILGRTLSQLFLPNIFGGRGRGGGFTAVGGDANNPFGGDLRFYSGFRRTGPDEVLEAFAGVGNVPNYNDLCYVVYNDVNVGESTTPPPIHWIFYREPAPWFGVPGGAGSPQVNVRAISGRYWKWYCIDLSAAAILYDILRNSLYGLGQPAYMIHGAGAGSSRGISGTFEDAQRQLVAEGLGMSMRFAGDRQGALDAIREIERTVDGVLNRDPETFQWKFKLIRDEAYDAPSFAALREFTPTEIVALAPLSEQLWSETLNVLTVEFSDAERFFAKNAVTLRNHANIAMTGGERPAPNVQYLSITDRATALRLCARDLKKLSLPLWKGQMKVTRAAWDLERGDVFKLTYAKYEFSQKLMRVLAVDFGDDANGTITVDIIEDVFHYADIARPTNTPTVPIGQRSIIAPSIIKATLDRDLTTGIGTLTVTVLDPEHRIVEVADRTQSGDSAASAWAVLATAAADTSDPLFPFNDHVTASDLSGNYVVTVALSADAPSDIEVRLTYIGYATIAAPASDNRLIDQVFSFDLVPSAASSAVPVVVHNGSGADFVYTQAGHQIVVH
jgi:hypothetical protein